MELAVQRPTHIQIQGPDGGTSLVELPLDASGSSCIIGSGPSVDIRIDNPSVSEKQCRIMAGDEGLRIEPLDPQWATFVNGVPISKAVALYAGDHVDFGDVTLEVMLKSPSVDPSPLTPRRAASLSAAPGSVRTASRAIRSAPTPAPVPSTRGRSSRASPPSRRENGPVEARGRKSRSPGERKSKPPPTPSPMGADLDGAVLERVRGMGAQYGFTRDDHVRALCEIIVELDDDLSGPDTKYPEIWYTLTNTAQTVEARLRRARTQVDRIRSRRAAVPEPPPPPPKPAEPSVVKPSPPVASIHDVTQPSPPPAPSAIDSDDNPPQDLAGFEIVEEIGRGGMGAVYRAKNTRLDIDVAIKVMRSLDSGDRLLQEARAAAKLQHPNIVQVLQFERVGTTGYYVMQLVRGLDGHRAIDKLRDDLVDSMTAEALCRRIRVDPPAASPECRAALMHPTPYYALVAMWMAGAADGLDYAHRAGIVHRDMKPSNLMIAPDGRMMVMDFGLAVPAHAQGEAGEGRVGTPRYLAPERVADWAARSGLSDNDPRADIWSLGVTMYEFLTLRPAYQGTEEVVLRSIVTTSPPAPTSLAWSVPPDLERICLKAMRRNPEERYAKAADMAADLRAWLAAGKVSGDSRLPKTAMDWLRFVSPKREK